MDLQPVGTGWERGLHDAFGLICEQPKRCTGDDYATDAGWMLDGRIVALSADNVAKQNDAPNIDRVPHDPYQEAGNYHGKKHFHG